MKSIKTAIRYGLVVWAVPFAVAVLIFPLRNSDRTFFESIMPVTVAIVTVWCTVRYFKKIETNFVPEGIWLGLIFFAVSLAIDLLMFSRGPMARSLEDYWKDIGFTYLLIPVITVGVGYALAKKKPYNKPKQDYGEQFAPPSDGANANSSLLHYNGNEKSDREQKR